MHKIPLLGCLLLLAISCQPSIEKQEKSTNQAKSSMPASIKKELFGQLKNGHSADIYTLTNSKGMIAQITPFGGILVSLLTPNRDGKLEDIVLGYDNLEGYINGTQNFGTTVGRYANRIGKGKFTLEGQDYQLALNHGDHHLHGGNVGFAKKLWKASPIELDDGVAIQLEYLSKDGEENYPGNLTVKVIYKLTNNNEIQIDYEATTDQTTILNLTHHSYFNLNGNGAGNILDHELSIDADKITETDTNMIPTGKLVNISNTPFDFRKATAIGSRINAPHEQLKFGRGYDHNWIINNWDQSLRSVATLYAPATGRMMETLTTEPGIQVYTANWLTPEVIGKKGRPSSSRQAVCLETQHFPDSPNQPSFPSVLLKPGEKYTQQTVYRFSVK